MQSKLHKAPINTEMLVSTLAFNLEENLLVLFPKIKRFMFLAESSVN